MKEFCGSTFWDADLTWNTEDPDFTSCFLQTALAWTPCVLFAVLAPFDIYFATINKYSNIPWSPLNISRLVINCALIVLMLSDVIVASTWSSSDIYDVHIVTPVVKLITFTLAAALGMYNRSRGIVSSGYIFSFWFVATILAIPQFRHEIREFERRPVNTLSSDATQLAWADYEFLSFMIFFPLLTIQLLLHLFADRPPLSTKYEKVDGENPSPELFAGFVQSVLFTWFDRFAWTGYRRSLEAEDMWDINPQDRSAEVVPLFDLHWKRNVEKNRVKSNSKASPTTKATKGVNGANSANGANGATGATTDEHRGTNGNIVPVLFRSFGGTFIYSGVMKLVIELLSFANPQILGLLIAFIADSTLPGWHGYLYAVTLFLLATVTSLLNGQFNFVSYLIGHRIRTVLISAIYRKALTISNAAKRNTTVGEIVNLMAVDAQRFFELIVYLHILWSGPLVIALCIYFLWQIIGVASLAGVVVMVLMIPLNGYVANKLKYFQVKQMVKKDERIKMMNEVLGGMKVLKLYAWEASFEEAVNKIRAKEMQIIKHSAVVNSYVFFVWNMIPFLVTIASFTTFVLVDPENNKITPSTVFVSLSLFNLLRMPMTMFPIMITMVMQAWVSVVRINKFLNAENMDEELVTKRKEAHAVRMDAASFSWGGEETVLQNINLAVPKGSIAAIVGPVGCGKSSLIASFLGETERIAGLVNTDGRMAYVAQQAWILNATLRDNILFGRPYERNFYQSVLEACALVQDLKILPGGDMTEIGEKGINLSGGQKQRVALARAVYSRADIYLLDDPLSAVDSHVGKHIFDNVLGPAGILAKSTRLLVTHGISYLPRCDTIYVMSSGAITETGRYEQLLASRGAFADFLVQHLQGTDDDDELLEIKQALTDTVHGEKLLERAISQISDISVRQRKMSTLSNAGGRRVSKALSERSEREAPRDGVKLINKEEAAVGSIGLGVYLRYFRSIGWTFLTLALVLSIINQVVQVYSNTWLSQWSARDDANQPDVRDLYLGVFGAFGIAQAIALFGSSLVLALGCLNAARVLHHNMLWQVMRLPMAFFDTTPLGRVMNRFSKDVDVVDVILPERIRTWIVMLFNTIAILVVISVQTPIFLAVIVPLAVLYYFIQNFYVATSRQLKRIESVTRSPIYSHFGESITGQSTIRAYGAQARFINDSVRRVDFNQQCSYPAIIAARWLAIRLEIIGGFVIFFAALFAVLNRGGVSGENVGLSITYALQITSVLSWLVRFTAEVETNIVANERLEEYTAVPTEAPWVTKKMDPEWPQVGAVKFVDFKVRYREGLDLVLKGIDVSIEGGQRVGIVGRTGAGKSSLTLALFRIIESAGGSITIDNIPIADIGLHSLRSRLTIIPQDPVLFSGTLRMNIDPFNGYSDEQIWTALEHAHLKAFVTSTSSGLLFEVAEGGENLSIGQRQLMCLARALLRKTKVLILDEATAAVDLETDDLIQRTIREQFVDCTVLTIAHRLNTILDSDRVLVLDAGVVAEYETPRRLLDDSQSIFHAMAKDAGLVHSNGTHALSEVKNYV